MGQGMQGHTNEKIRAEDHPRALRNAPADVESRLWQRLRGRQIENCKFRRQHPFGDYILDFVCLERKIVVELDGGQHVHASDYDGKRSRFLEQAGYVVLRFWNNEILENMEGVLEVILRALRDKADPIPTQPSP
jgi:very-short-patch-repair endonuclease